MLLLSIIVTYCIIERIVFMFFLRITFQVPSESCFVSLFVINVGLVGIIISETWVRFDIHTYTYIHICVYVYVYVYVYVCMG